MAEVDTPAPEDTDSGVFDQGADDWTPAGSDDWLHPSPGTDLVPASPGEVVPTRNPKDERAERKAAEKAAKQAEKRAGKQARNEADAMVRQRRARAKQRAAKRKKVPRRSRVPFWRGRVLPKSVLGISMLILAFGLGAAVSGTALYMNYQYKKDRSDALVRTFDARAARARETLNADATNARAQIQTDLAPLRKLAATGETLETLLNKSQPSIWAVRTYDEAGQAVIGTAFVVASDSEKSFLVTSFNVVRAATVKPGPDILLRKGDEELKATLWTWQEDRDLALLILDKPSLPRLEWAAPTDTKLGTQVFALSGLGTAGGAITQGFVADVSTSGIQHTAPTGTSFQGGPIMNDRGKVVAVASRVYAPLGFTSDGVWFAPPISAACQKILKCPAGQVTGAGSPR